MSVDQQANLDITNPAPTPEDATPHTEPGSVTPPVAEAPKEEESYEAPSGPSAAEDVARLLPDPAAPFKLACGIEVTARPLKLREFLALLKIVTRGAAMAMQSIRLDTNDDDFMQSMMSLFIFAIPEAEDEACDFLRLMVEPSFLPAEKYRLQSQKDDAYLELNEALENPDLEDLFTIIEVIIRREGKDLRSLGKRLGKMMETAQKAGQI